MTDTGLDRKREFEREVDRRRTFAIISHSDAGKTTLTEKLLLYGGAIHLAGSIKSRRAAKHAVSYGKEPLELMEEIEQDLGLQTYPMNWPVGMGKDFQGVYDRQEQKVLLFDEDTSHGQEIVDFETVDIDDPEIERIIGRRRYEQLQEEVELLEIAGDEFDLQKVRAGEMTPVFFGSAITNVGVQPFLEGFLEMAPSPAEGQRFPVEPQKKISPGSSLKSRPTWTPNTATGSPSCASCRANTNATCTPDWPEKTEI